MKKTILIIFLLYFNFRTYTQSVSEINFMKVHLQPKAESTVNDTYKENLKTDGSEIQLLFSSLFWVYKSFFSSQDNSNCSFHPSCSVYGIECIKKHGMIKGGVYTMDRLTRCNGMSPHKYQVDYKRRLLLDPVK